MVVPCMSPPCYRRNRKPAPAAATRPGWRVLRARWRMRYTRDPPATTMATHPLPALIEAAERGEAGAAEALFTALYGELHRIARRQLAQHGWGVTIGATSLLHEAYLDLSNRDGRA